MPLIFGTLLIRSGLRDIVVAGGTEALTRFHLNGFKSLMILDEAPCRPFDATRAGLNLGEGAAFIVLESEESALRRGVKPLAELRGTGNACDAYHQTASSEDGEGAYLAMTKALQDAGLEASEIQYVNAHGTGTPNNDASESAALRRVFGEKMPPVSSTKGFTGHTTSASGSIETVFSLLALRHQFVPENLVFTQKDPACIVPYRGEPLERPLRGVMCNSFGFGGNDSSLIISAYGE
jgi:3-oxoacyl-(acyl-carrier-protein) synthase